MGPALSKLTIRPEVGGPFPVLFNPNSYSISKAVTWSPPQNSGDKKETKREVDAPPLQFGGGGSRQLSLELFFDVTETGNDVRIETDKLVALTLIDRTLQRPPTCEISWGPKRLDFPFTGVVTSLGQKFTLFKSDGSPVRATISVTFTEYLRPEDNKRKNDPELTTWLVKRGDTLSNIAAQIYRDPRQWRPIAEANHLDDPLRLKIGQRLSIPELR